MKVTSINTKLCPPSQAVIPVNDHGFLYGDGVFEGLRFYNRRILKFKAHLDRLERSARSIALTLPYSIDEIVQSVLEVVEASPEADGYLRLIITRGPGSMGIDPRTCTKGNLIVIADELAMVSNSVREKGARLIVSSIRRLSSDQVDARIKSLNYMNQILARIEANNAGADEAVVLNQSGYVAEGTADNIFIVQSGKLVTPPASDGALEGITRDIIIDLAEQVGLPVHQASLSAHDLYNADECFLTGTGAELIPVKEVTGRPLKACPGPAYQRLNAAFQEAIRDGRYFDDSVKMPPAK